MKKKDLKGLKLNKKLISSLNKKQTVGGSATDGCTDGCSPLRTLWNCTKANCTADCPLNSREQCSNLIDCSLMARCSLDVCNDPQ